MFAQLVQHPEQESFLNLRNRISDPTVLREAQEILIRSGAVSYTAYQIMIRYQKAQAILGEINLSYRKSLDQLLQDLALSVRRLLTLTGE